MSVRLRSTLTRAGAPPPPLAEARRAVAKGLDAWLGKGTPAAMAAPHRQGSTAAPEPRAPATAAEAQRAVAQVERQLDAVLRAMIDGSSASPAVAAALANQATRAMIELRAWQQVQSGLEANPTPGAGLHRRDLHGQQAALRQLHRALVTPSDDRDQRFRRIAALCKKLPKPPTTGTPATKPPRLEATEAAALVEMLASAEPDFGAIVRERLALGAAVGDLAASLTSRTTSVLDEVEATGTDDDGLIDSYTFDIGTNSWVRAKTSSERSWVFDVRLAQLLGFEVDGVVHGVDDLGAKLAEAATNPLSGVAVIGAQQIRSFCADLATVASDQSASKLANDLLELRFDFSLVATKGGDLPQATAWDPSPKELARLLTAIDDPNRVQALASAAAKIRAVSTKALAAKKTVLAPVLAKHKGKPLRHKRAHWAMINLGQLGQSVFEIARDGGPLPKSQTQLEPATVSTKHAAADETKLRFVITDEYNVFVLSDAQYSEVGAKYGFPPNHELLSYNRPVVATGYVTIDHGTIVAIEDDGIMVPGKLPADLPPAEEIMQALGFPLDHDKIAAASCRVLDWKAFAISVPKAKLPAALAGATLEQLKQAIVERPHASRAPLVAAVLRRALTDAREANDTEAKAVAAVAKYAASLLDGFQLINVGIRAFADGELPTDADGIDAEIALCLAKKVAKA